LFVAQIALAGLSPSIQLHVFLNLVNKLFTETQGLFDKPPGTPVSTDDEKDLPSPSDEMFSVKEENCSACGRVIEFTKTHTIIGTGGRPDTHYCSDCFNKTEEVKSRPSKKTRLTVERPRMCSGCESELAFVRCLTHRIDLCTHCETLHEGDLLALQLEFNFIDVAVKFPDCVYAYVDTKTE
jgi:hypothetical protein